jgi:signal transduction histidine kinase
VLLETWRKPTDLTESDLGFAITLVGLLALAMDRFRLRREVRDSRQMLEEASRMQQDILSSLSHDMRTPLASIKGYASALLLDEVQWQSDTVHEYLQIIVEESDHLGEIIVDLLETSMIDAGHLKIEVEPVRLDRIAHQVVDGISRRANGHRFVVSFPPDFPIVDADGGRIRRVLFNLLDNAIKYSPAGGLIVVRGEMSESEILVSVADQGQGIAPEHLNRLFEKFFRAKFVSGKHIVGTGLGLPIARTIVELHGGRIWAESKPGEGTTLYFTLPRGGLSQSAVGGEE